MGIIVGSHTRVVVQGMGRNGRLHARISMEYGTKVVAGVTPGKGGTDADGVPLFNSVEEAKRATGCNASIIFVPAPFAADAILEAEDAGMDVAVCITEGIPALDMAKVKRILTIRKKMRLIGPNCPGVITPATRTRVGIMPPAIFTPGPVGVISRSGTLTYEAVDQLTRIGIGQSTCVGIGGDPVVGSDFVDILELFARDDETRLVVLIGEIGGSAEEEAADYIKRDFKKPVVGFIAGVTAPPGRRMGHAGAIISAGQGTAQSKIDALRSAGVYVTENPSRIGEMVKEVMGRL